MKKKYTGLQIEKVLFSSTDCIVAAQSGCRAMVSYDDTNLNGVCDGAEDGSGNYMELWISPHE
jgi:hypothetical protein